MSEIVTAHHLSSAQTIASTVEQKLSLLLHNDGRKSKAGPMICFHLYELAEIYINYSEIAQPSAGIVSVM